MNKADELLNFDRRHLWHPYSAADGQSLAVVCSADGCKLRMDDGNTAIDGMASWWAAIHGYNHPRLNRAIVDQLHSMAHIMFGGLTHQPAVHLTKQLIRMLPNGLNQVFYCDSGSVAVEIAAKMVWQYWQGAAQSFGVAPRHKFISMEYAYHGDTCMAMSLCDPQNSMHNIFRGLLREQIFAPAPRFQDRPDHRAEQALEALFDKNSQHIAAMFIEPLVQGAGGMRFYHSSYLNHACQLCRAYETLMVFDEIATGFGRTGSLFAMQQSDCVPDIMCLGKALSAGCLSFAAVVTNPCVAEMISRSPPGILMHGPTYMGNPLACAVALENLRMLSEGAWQQQVHSIEQQMHSELTPYASRFSKVKQVRVKGAIGVVELHDLVDVALCSRRMLERGVWLRPFRNLIYIIPPYTISPDELTAITAAIGEELAVM